MAYKIINDSGIMILNAEVIIANFPTPKPIII
jgi:hypothetical protein